jgi:glycosyltransferase involved in cell wall biosynthesis
MLLVAVPLADTADAILRRSGGIPVSLAAWRSLPRRVFTPDSLHFHHRLRRAGLSVRQAAGALWLVAIVFALCALAFALSTAAGWGAIACTLVAAGVTYRRVARAGAATSSSPEPVRILLVINDLILGGAQRVLLDQVRALDGGRFRIEVASLEIDPGGPVGEALERHGIRVHRLRRRGEPRVLALPRLALRVLALRPELVHTHLAAAGVGGRIVARALGVRVVVSTQHNLSDWEERRCGWLRRADRATLFLADRIVTVSDAVRGAMAAVLPALGARGVTVHHGIDPDRFRRPPGARAEARGALGLASDVMTVVAVARLDPRKGIDVLLDGLAQLPPGHAWVLCVVGDGPERRALEARARTLGIAHAVRFEGAHEDVRPWLWAADLCAVPSRTEGLGVVVIEALAAGTPVFASPVGGIPELLGAGRGGRLVAGVHAEAWMEALAPVFSSPAKLAPLAAAAPEHAAAFSLERAAGALAGVYERCLARSGAAVAPARPLALRQGVPASVPVPVVTVDELERAA